MKPVALLLAAATLLVGCGGGGGGGNSSPITVTGVVGDVVTFGSPVNPAATVSGGSSSTTTSLQDGSFQVTVPSGATSLVVTTASSSGYGTWVFQIPPATANEDVGNLLVGPTKINVTGTVQDSTTNAGISGAVVSLAGRSATTNSAGVFTLQGVANSTDTTATAPILSITGSVKATNYFLTSFTPSVASFVAGSPSVLTIPNILLVPLSDSNPPGTPYNIYGLINPASLAQGATVTLSQSGTAIRSTSPDAAGFYYFWVPAGTYSVSVTNGSHSAGPFSVPLPTSNTVVRQDATLQ